MASKLQTFLTSCLSASHNFDFVLMLTIRVMLIMIKNVIVIAKVRVKKIAIKHLMIILIQEVVELECVLD